jgi:hypothetical protein
MDYKILEREKSTKKYFDELMVFVKGNMKHAPFESGIDNEVD